MSQGLFVPNSARTKIALALPARPLQAGILGDSITRNQISQYTVSSAQIGTSVLWTSRAWALFATQLSGRRMWTNIYACEGYSGYRTDQVFAGMLPSTATAAIGSDNSATIPWGVLANKPDICFELSGTNDIGAIVTFSWTVSQCLANVLQGRRAIWKRLLDNGILPIAISLLPRSSPALNASDVPTFNAAIAAMAAEWGIPFIDVYTNCANTDGSWKTGYTFIGGSADAAGLHPGSEACQSMAADIWAQLSPYIGFGETTPTIYGATSNITLTTSKGVTAAAVAVGGTGYVVGDTITLTNSNLVTAQTAAVLKVTGVLAGVVTTASVLVPGLYPTTPSNPVGQQSTQAYGGAASGAGAGATFNLTLGSLFDSARKGESFANFDTGLFPNTTGWAPRYDPNSASTTSVGADALAQYGSALIASIAAPGSSSNYADWWGPGSVTVNAGEKYAFFGRVQCTAGSIKDSLQVGLQGSSTPGAMLTAFGNGGSAQTASTVFGNSLSARDFYQEVVIPPLVTSVRPWITTQTYPGAGQVVKLAQLGLARVA